MSAATIFQVFLFHYYHFRSVISRFHQKLVFICFSLVYTTTINQHNFLFNPHNIAFGGSIKLIIKVHMHCQTYESSCINLHDFSIYFLLEVTLFFFRSLSSSPLSCKPTIPASFLPPVDKPPRCSPLKKR